MLIFYHWSRRIILFLFMELYHRWLQPINQILLINDSCIIANGYKTIVGLDLQYSVYILTLYFSISFMTAPYYKTSPAYLIKTACSKYSNGLILLTQWSAQMRSRVKHWNTSAKPQMLEMTLLLLSSSWFDVFSCFYFRCLKLVFTCNSVIWTDTRSASLIYRQGRSRVPFFFTYPSCF